MALLQLLLSLYVVACVATVATHDDAVTREQDATHRDNVNRAVVFVMTVVLTLWTAIFVVIAHNCGALCACFLWATPTLFILHSVKTPS